MGGPVVGNGDVTGLRVPAAAAGGSLPGGAPRSGSAQRLRPRGGGNPALARLAELAQRLLGSSACQVSLLTDVHTVAGGAGLPPGTVGSQGPLEESLCTVTAAGGAPLVVTRASTDTRVADLPPVVSGVVGSYLGVPLTADDGHAVGALCVFDPSPRSWSEADVTVLTQLAASAVAELELAALNAEHGARLMAWEVAIEAAGVGAYEWDLVSGTLTWDDRLLEMFGYDQDSFVGTIEAFNARVHPEDLPRVNRVLQDAMDLCTGFELEYRVEHPDGDRWVLARGRAFPGVDGTAVRVLGAAVDTTAAREADARVVRVLESMPAAFFSLDRDWTFTYVNARAERLLDRPRDGLLGGNVWQLFPAAVGSDFEKFYRGAMDSGEPSSFEAYYPAPLDAWYEVQAWPAPDGLSVYFHDITAWRAAQAQAEDAAQRTSLLAEVTSELIDTFDADEAVARLAQKVVPALSDWCIVTLVADEDEKEDGLSLAHGLRDVGWWHVDPAARPLVECYVAERLPALTDRSFLMKALRTRQAVQVQARAAEAISATLPPGPARDLVGRLSPESVVVVPLRGRGRTVGLLTLYNGSARGVISPEELEVVREVADRAGLALDNSRLYRQQRRLAEELQRSMLTDPPEPDHMQIVVRYVPASEAAQVGGDWYDAFLQPDGATTVVIGDVIGHDIAAAAAMGQVRTLLRGIGAATGDGPAHLLTQVDQVMERLRVGTTATAVVARFEQTDEELKRLVTRLRWSNAGHPPPMLLDVDGTVTVLAVPAGIDADLLLGIDPSTTREESALTLDPGATVLLYTDGLVERRDQSLDVGLARLRDTLRELAEQDLTLDELCEALLQRMLPTHPDDDVALLAVRLHRQDQPRPAAAGPNRVPAPRSTAG